MLNLSPERWQQVSQVLDEVLDLAPDDRAAHLDAVCADDPDLRSHVERMLAADEAAGTFISTPAAERSAPLVDALEEPALRVGPYETQRVLGRGGMGVVYLADRVEGEFEQRVALKLLRPGMLTPEGVERFRAERRILARLQHPGIARLYDGGMTPDGRPYLVLAYVEGQPITAYGNTHRLPIEARLRLFLEVCRAVQYAHRNLIVHRDLKPSNILVTENGEVKLLDFGIAKMVQEDDEEAPLTRTGVLVMTPEYAAPEQVRGEPVTTATDIYALGLLLYELLTGQRAHRFPDSAPGTIERVVCETMPPRPSSAPDAATTLRGDLDTICLKALRKEPERRYASAEALADDVERYLRGLPVAARPDTVGYRTRKFVQRHRLGVAAAAFVLLALVGGLSVALWQARVAAQERDRAQLEAEKAREVRDFLVNLFEVNDPSASKGQTLTADEILTRGAAQVDADLDDQPEVQAEMLSVLGEVYWKLGMYDEARPLVERALTLRTDLFGPAHPSVAASMDALGRIHHYQGDFETAGSLLRDALDRRRHALPADHLDVAASELHLGDILFEEGNYDDAEWLFRRALAARSATLGADDPDTAEGMYALASVLHEQGRYDEAQRLYERALTTFLDTVGEEHASTALVYYGLGQLHRTRGELSQAEAHFRRALAIDRTLYGDDHYNVALDLNDLGVVLRLKGAFDEAETLYREALAIQRSTFGSDHPNTAVAEYNLGVLLTDQGRLDAAEPLIRRAVEVYRDDFGAEHEYTATGQVKLAVIARKRGDHARADTLLHGAIATLEEALPAGHHRIAEARLEYGHLRLAQNRPADAEPLLRDGLRSLEATFANGTHQLGQARSLLGACLAAQQRYDEAEPLLRTAFETLQSVQGVDHPNTRAAQQWLRRLNDTQDRTEQPARLTAGSS